MIVIFLHKKTLIYAENMPFLLYFTIEKYECQELNLYLDYLAKGVPFAKLSHRKGLLNE